MEYNCINYPEPYKRQAKGCEKKAGTDREGIGRIFRQKYRNEKNGLDP
jgi:hypothetical protein